MKFVLNNRAGLLLLLLACMVAVAGCGGNDNAPAGSGSDPGTATAGNTGSSKDPADSGEKITLKFANWGDPAEQKIFEGIFRKFNEQHPNIEVEYMYIPYGEYLTKLNTMAASDTLPDLGQMMESATISWAEKGMFEDVSPVLSQMNPKLESSYFAKTPAGEVGPSFISEIFSLWYSKDMFEEAGVPFPPATTDSAWTWDEFVEAAIKLTKDNNGKHPNEEGFDARNIKQFGVNAGLGELGWLPFAISNGGGFVSEDGKQLLLDHPKTIEAIQNVADLMNKHHVMPTMAQRKSVPGADTAFLTKQVAMSIDGTWSLLWLGKAVQEKGLQLGVGVLPKYEKPVTVNTGPAIVIFKGTKHKEAALELYKFINDTNNILPNVQSGLWLSSEEQWYTDPELIAKWTDTPIHPEEYKTAVIEYAARSTVQTPYYYMSNYAKIFDIVNPALDQVWTGKKTAEEVIVNEVMPKIKPLFEADFSQK